MIPELMKWLGGSLFTWERKVDCVSPSETRSQCLSALGAADNRNIRLLIASLGHKKLSVTI